MFERFTERARQIVVLAQEEARASSDQTIEPKHLLLGVLGENEGIGAQVLKSLGFTLEGIRDLVGEEVSSGPMTDKGGQIPFTKPSKDALELALREALSMGHNYVGTEHVLLGLVRHGD